MKYSIDQFNETLKCFDATIRAAEFFGRPVDFVCIPYYGGTSKGECKQYCPRFACKAFGGCFTRHSAKYWKFAKEKFIIENEPEGSEEDIK